jgi:hypothetical protein
MQMGAFTKSFMDWGSARPSPISMARQESNWLPAPAGKFILMLRMYWANESARSILDSTWTIPPVKKV